MIHSLARAGAIAAYALGALGRRRAGSVAAGACLALAAFVLASVVAVTEALRAEAQREIHAIPELAVSRSRGGRPAVMSASEVAAVARAAGVATATPRVWGYLFTEGLESNLVIVGTEGERSGGALARVVHGTAPASGTRGWVVLGEGVLRALGIARGDRVALGAPGGGEVELTVRASFAPETAMRTADVALMDARDARAVLGLRDGEATDVAATLSRDASPVAVASAVRALFPGANASRGHVLAGAYEASYGVASGGLAGLALLPALLAAFVVAWDRGTSLSREEREERDALGCAGWGPSHIATARLIEAATVAAAAAVTAALSAYAYVFVLGAPGLLRAVLGASTLATARGLVPAEGGTPLLLVSGLVVAPYVFASVARAWRAARGPRRDED